MHILRQRRARRVAQPPAPGATPTPNPEARGVSVEEGFLGDVDVLPTPAGFGTEVSTSSQTNVEIATYTVPDGTVAKLSEASLALEANGQAQVAVAGTVYGPYTGAADITVPFEHAVLKPGYQVRVVHQSTDGVSTTTAAQLVVEEV